MKNEMKNNAVMKCYRMMNKLYHKNIPIIPNLIRLFIRIIFSCDLPYTVEIGKNVLLGHNGLGVVIHKNAKIGEGSSIYQNVTIGGRNRPGAPIIGKNVFIGPGACILGKIHIGDGASIGPNAVVIKDVPANSLIVTPLALMKNK
jgi:serine O-acetyltransferase